MIVNSNSRILFTSFAKRFVTTAISKTFSKISDPVFFEDPKTYGTENDKNQEECEDCVIETKERKYEFI